MKLKEKIGSDCFGETAPSITLSYSNAVNSYNIVMSYCFNVSDKDQLANFSLFFFFLTVQFY